MIMLLVNISFSSGKTITDPSLLETEEPVSDDDDTLEYHAGKAKYLELVKKKSWRAKYQGKFIAVGKKGIMKADAKRRVVGSFQANSPIKYFVIQHGVPSPVVQSKMTYSEEMLYWEKNIMRGYESCLQLTQ